MLKKIIKLVLFVSLSTVNVSFAAEVDKVMAVVDGNIITSLEVEKMKNFMVALGAIDSQSYDAPDVNKQILDFQIDRELQLEVAKKFNIEANTNPETLHNNFLQSRGYSPEEFTALLADNHITEKYFIARLQENQKIEQVQKSFIGNNVKITDKMAYEFLEKYHNDNTEYLIKDISFAKGSPKHTASEYKDIISKAISSGEMPADVSISDLGYKILAQLPDIYQSIAPELKKGTPSDIIAAPNGMHILWLVDKKEPESIQLEQAKLSLYREGIAKEIASWLDKLKQAAYIKVY